MTRCSDQLSTVPSLQIGHQDPSQRGQEHRVRAAPRAAGSHEGSPRPGGNYFLAERPKQLPIGEKPPRQRDFAMLFAFPHVHITSRYCLAKKQVSLP